MLKPFFALCLCLIAATSLSFAQTIISDAIDFTETDPEAHALYTKDGNYFIGRALFIRNDTLGFQIRQLDQPSIFLLRDIRFLGLTEESVQQATNTTLAEGGLPPDLSKDRRWELPMPVNQLLYSGTAIPYESNGTFRNTMVFANQVDYQLTENFTIGGGALIPALLMAKAKAQISASEMLHLGLAAHQFIVLVDELNITHPYAIVTVGQRDRYLNFTMGYWIERYSGFSSSTDTYPMVTLGGSFAFAKGWRFYVEAAAVFQTLNNLVLPTFNFSNHRRKGMFEFGIMAIPDTQIPVLPLISYHRVF